MRGSCNGCRVLRKGCSEDCSIRPCLQWLMTPESQGNATLFLAKFYGRTGLVNLIDAGPENLRPAIFRSLLYEVCGRVVDPINGAAGLLSMGSWNLCQAAVDAVLRGAPVTSVQNDAATNNSRGSPAMRLRTVDIRHVHKNNDAHGMSKANRRRFKRHGTSAAAASRRGRDFEGESRELKPEVASRDLPLQRRWSLPVQASNEPAAASMGLKHAGAGRNCRSSVVDGVKQKYTVSEDTTDGSMITIHEEEDTANAGGEAELDLSLTLNFEKTTPRKPIHNQGDGPSSSSMRCDGSDCPDIYAANLALRLALTA